MDADLNDLSAFAAVAAARSFRGAAVTSGVAASSLSEAVRRLEGRLGVRLLNRTTRSVTPTEAGQNLLARLSPALIEVAAALDSVNGEGVMRLVRAACKRGVAGVMVTHDAQLASWADRVVFLRDGRVVDQTRPPDGPESLLAPEAKS